MIPLTELCLHEGTAYLGYGNNSHLRSSKSIWETLDNVHILLPAPTSLNPLPSDLSKLPRNFDNISRFSAFICQSANRVPFLNGDRLMNLSLSRGRAPVGFITKQQVFGLASELAVPEDYYALHPGGASSALGKECYQNTPILL